MENWSYKNILNKIKKIENSIKRLEMIDFTIDKNTLKEIIVANKLYDDRVNLDCLKIHNELNDLLNHLYKLERIAEYYTLIKFRLNDDKNIGLCLDIYVNDTLNILKPLNQEIKEYGYGNLGKFIAKFYNLVYFLIKLEIGVNGESEIYKEMYTHSGHAYYLREIVVSDLNRTRMNDDDRQNLKNKVREKTYDGFVDVITKLVKGDRKIRKILKLSDIDIQELSNKRVESDQMVLSEIKRLVKKKD